MGQKVNPLGLRLNISRVWDSKWYSNKDYTKLIKEDFKIREEVEKLIKDAGISKIVIERPSSKSLSINVHVARPGVVLGKKRNLIDVLRKNLTKISASQEVKINLVEVKKPDLDAKITAQSVALQLERRISFRRAMKKALQSALKSGAKGIKIACSGRLGGAEIARTEWYKEGSIPLHTLRSDIDYSHQIAQTTYGVIGVKVWIYRGDKNIKIKNSSLEENKNA